MKYLITITLTLSLLSIISCSSTTNSSSPSITKDEIVKNKQSLLWKIEKKGHQTSYIFGTMHMIEKEYYNLTEHMENIIVNSDAVVMEIGGTPNPLAAFQMLSLKEGSSVQDYFSETQLKDLISFMNSELNISPQQFNITFGGMKPFYILQTITQAYFSNNTMSYDLNIMQMAEKEKIELLGFESMEEQLGFFDQIPDSSIAEMIMTSVTDFEKEKKSTLKLQKLYAKERVDKLIPLMKDQSPEFMAFEDIFLNNRNKAWIPKIETYTQTKKCFIAVGAAHLFDTNGVLNLLEAKGFIITPIKK